MNTEELDIVEQQGVEEWRPIVGYEGLYEVSSLGRVKSIARMVPHSDGGHHFLAERIMKPFVSKQGYIYIVLTGYDSIPKRKALHRLVANAFVANDNAERNHIDHIDGNRTNNIASNIRWVTRIENMHNPITEARIDAAIGRRVIGIAPDGTRKEYHQIKDVEKDGFNRHKVCSCCGGHRKHHKGYQWEYAV